MYYKVKRLGRISETSYAFLIERDKIISKLYVTIAYGSILIIGYPFRIGLAQLYIPYKNPTPDDVEELLKLHPIKLLNNYKPKIKIIIEFPPLKNYKKLHTFGEMRFVVYEYEDGYIIIDTTSARIGIGKIPYFNDDIFDILQILYNTKIIPFEMLLAIDSVGTILTFYAMM